MRIKGVSVNPELLSSVVTEHAKKLSLIRSDEVLKFEFIEVNDPRLGVIFKKSSNDDKKG